MSKVITVIGSLNTDLVTVTPRVPVGGETLTASSFSTGPGGKGANQAVAAARLSRPNPVTRPNATTSDITVRMVGAVGADEFGPQMIKSLRSSQIDTSSILTQPELTTGVAVILVEASSGENRILLNPGANHSLNAVSFLTPESLGAPAPDLIILQLEIPLATVLQIISTAKAASIPILLNPAPAVPLPAQTLNGLAHLIVNESEAAILSSLSESSISSDPATAASKFLAAGVKNVTITLGAKGAYFHGVGMTQGTFVDAERVEKVVDTTAAGDTFVGAYAVGVVRKGGVKVEDVRAACKAAGRTVEKAGAQASIPWADEV